MDAARSATQSGCGGLIVPIGMGTERGDGLELSFPGLVIPRTKHLLSFTQRLFNHSEASVQCVRESFSCSFNRIMKFNIFL